MEVNIFRLKYYGFPHPDSEDEDDHEVYAIAEDVEEAIATIRKYADSVGIIESVRKLPITRSIWFSDEALEWAEREAKRRQK